MKPAWRRDYGSERMLQFGLRVVIGVAWLAFVAWCLAG